MEEDPLAACKGVPVTVLRRLRCRFATETIDRSAGAEFDSVNGRERGTMRGLITRPTASGVIRGETGARCFGGNVGGNLA
jgi:hypothetical protein